MKKILIIDDEITLLDTMKQMLNEYDVTAESNSRKANRLLMNEDNHFDLIVMDMLMPEMDGVEILLSVRKHFAKQDAPKIIAISGGGFRDADGYLNMAEQFGADYSLVKPFLASELRAMVKSLLGE